MKKTASFIMCILMLLSLYGCRKQDPATKLERQLTGQILAADYLDADVNGSIKMPVENFGEHTFKLSGNMKIDASYGFPNTAVNGSFGLQDTITLPFAFYMTESNMTTSFLGQSSTKGIDDNTKNSIKNGLSTASSNHADLMRTVRESTYNDNRALEIHYDINQLNSLLKLTGNEDTEFEFLTLFYLLNDDDSLKGIVIQTIINGKQRMEINTGLTILSMNKPVSLNIPD